MARLVGSCPSCSAPLNVRRLECRECGVGIDGDFEFGPLARLDAEQLGFVEVFLRARGKIKDVEDELGISYPTVVARLNDVVAALDQLPGPPSPRSTRQGILDDLAAGRLSAATAAARLRELAHDDD